MKSFWKPLIFEDVRDVLMDFAMQTDQTVGKQVEARYEHYYYSGDYIMHRINSGRGALRFAQRLAAEPVRLRNETNYKTASFKALGEAGARLVVDPQTLPPTGRKPA